MAQLVEQLTCNQQVVGSIPIASSKIGGIPEWPKGADCKSVSIAFGLVVQLVRMPACHAGGRGFESLPGRQFNMLVWLNGRAADL